MTDTRDIVLGDRTFAVPALPLRHNRVIYPLCRDLSVIKEGDGETFIARLVKAGGTPDAVRDDEWPKLEKIALHGAMAAEKTFTPAEFDDLAVTMPQLIDAFFIVRMQTGVWVQSAALAGDDDLDAGVIALEEGASGEGQGAISPRQ